MADQRLVLSTWDALDDGARRDLAESTAHSLPEGWRFTGIQRPSLGATAHDVALFEHDRDAFALIPGGTVTLGWDRRPFTLDDARRSALQADMQEFFSTTESLEEVLDERMTPLRSVALKPFLIEVTPKPATDYLGDVYDVEDDGEGDTYSELLQKQLRERGFRLPTSDEWEHACAAGSRAFFRWGDEWPDGVPYGDETSFDLHTRPNAFGLRIVESPYQVECIAELGFRAGDGGGAICGGTPTPYVWHTFASAYLHPFEHAEECLPETYEGAWVRRVYDLP